jgi:cholesterol transport system auxiliary component
MSRVLVAALLVSVAGCLPSGATREAQRYYVLEPPEPKTGRARATLVVPPTTTVSFYDTHDLVYSRAPGTRAYYQFNSLTERPARAIHQALLARLERSGTSKNSLVLRTHLEEIYHDAAQPPGAARIVLSAELVDPSRNAVLAQRTFRHAAPAPTYDAQGAVQGFTQALGALLDEVVAWVNEHAVSKGQ